MNKKYIALLSAVVVLLITSCGKKNVGEVESNKAFCITDSLRQLISIDTAKEVDVTGELNLSGKVTFNEEKVLKIYPLASGTVQEANVSLGDYVKQGQVLAVIKSADVAGILNDAAAAESDLAIAKRNLDATEKLYKGGISSETDYITAQKGYQKAQAMSNKSKEIMKIYGESDNNLSSYIIKSPISGFIVEKKVNTGSEIRSDNGDNLFTVSDLKDVWVIANVYESDIAKIQTGYVADVTTLSYPDKKFSGKVDRIFSTLDPETKVLNIRIPLDNADYLLKPGMFAHITLRYPENKKMLSIPSKAVIFDDNKYYVVVYKGKCAVSMQQVSIYKTMNGNSYIEEGNLHDGDQVITNDCLFIFTALKKM